MSDYVIDAGQVWNAVAIYLISHPCTPSEAITRMESTAQQLRVALNDVAAYIEIVGELPE